jgi:hypothetical protein
MNWNSKRMLIIGAVVLLARPNIFTKPWATGEARSRKAGCR